ncbi:translation initiation factor IF-2 N-terminal domain-containing protein, partial [Virgibacillus sp.]
MSKMRVYEYAKQNNLSSKAVVAFLKEQDIDVTNHMSTISPNTIALLDKKFKVQKQEKEESKQQKMEKQSDNQSNLKQSQTHNKKQNKPNNSQKPKKQQQKPQGKQVKKGKANTKAQPKQAAMEKETPKAIKYHGTLTVSELADKLNKEASEIIKKLMFLGVMATKN